MLRLANICSLTEFRQNTKGFVDQMKASGSPLVLTVNGRAEIVVYESTGFQTLLDRLEAAESEVQKLREQLGIPTVTAPEDQKKTP
jgi:PHD/YefM family antitoxin component YafN of YafNO toxin-antitoxin module